MKACTPELDPQTCLACQTDIAEYLQHDVQLFAPQNGNWLGQGHQMVCSNNALGSACVQVAKHEEAGHLEARVVFLSQLAAWQSACMEDMLKEIRMLHKTAHGSCPRQHSNCIKDADDS